MIMTRADRVMLALVLAGGWAIGTTISLVIDSTPPSLVLNAVASLGGAVTVWAEIRGANAAWSWGGAVVAAVAFTAAAAGPSGTPLWLAGASWIFVIVAGITASYADTSLDGVLELAAGVLAVVNASPSISGRYPNLGPEVVVANGITLIDDAGMSARIAEFSTT